VVIASQNLRGSVPKIIRNNCDIWVLFKCKNQQKVLIEFVYPALSSQYALEEWLTYYNHYLTMIALFMMAKRKIKKTE
jgi:hypothetical protein